MTKTTTLLAASASAFALLATAPAFAQDADEDVIIVSATKRDTTLQETPVSVQVTTADVIEDAQILDIKDLQSVVPTFRVSQLQNAGNTTLSIRGFGNGGNNIGIEPSVGLYIDGIYRSRAAAQIGDLPNLERVEVVSGPQSTLFGKNAPVGVVSIVTAKPEFETSGYIEGGLGNFDQNYVKGYITGGITDTVAISLGGGYQLRDGYFEPAEGTQGGDFNDIDRFNIRAQALWEPTDTFSGRFIVDRSTLEENCCGVATAVVGPTAAVVNALGGQIPTPNDPFSLETAVNRPTDNEIDDGGWSAEFNWDVDLLGGVTFTSLTSDRGNTYDFNSDSDFTSLELLENTFQFVDIDTFTQEFRITSNNPGRLSWLVGGFYQDETIEQDSGLDFGSDLRAYIDVLAGGPATISAVELTAGLAPGTAFGDQVLINETFRQENDSWSIFGNVDFEVTDRFTISLGGNYTEDSKRVSASTENNDAFSDIDLQTNAGTGLLANGAIEASFGASSVEGDPTFSPIAQAFTDAFNIPLNAGTFAAVAGFPDPTGAFANAQELFVEGVRQTVISGLVPLQFQPQFLAFPNAVESGRTDDDEFTYSIKGSYEINDNFNAYAGFSTGFKASSFNLTRDSRPFLTDAAALDAAGLLPNNFTPATGRNFGTRFALPEEIELIEIGLKAKFDWGAFNIALFDQTVENFQSTIFQGTGFVLSNAGEQDTQGIELSSTFTPVEGLTLGLAGIWQDPEYVDFQGAPVVVGSEPDLANDGIANGVGDLSGEQPAGINELAFSASAQYDFQLNETIAGFIRGDYQFEDEVQVVDNIPGVERDTSIFNGAVGFTFDESLSVRFWGRNLFDHETFTSAFPGVVQAGTVNAYPNQPRTYGVSVRKSF